MAFTYGFYNAINHDRRYDAIQMSSIFDGIIEDGIFMTIGDQFNVVASGTNMTVTVGPGRAWFDHTWSLNDSKMPLTLSASELVFDRYDAVVLEVNSQQSVRANSIKIVKGTPSANPAYPNLINTSDVHQHVLAYIKVSNGVSIIRQADVTNMVGKDATPYVTGPLETISIETMVAQWEDQWKKWFEEHTADWTTEWDDFYKIQTDLMKTTTEKWKKDWETFYNTQTSTMSSNMTQWKRDWETFYNTQTSAMERKTQDWTDQWQTWYSEHTIDWSTEFNDFYEKQTNLMLEAKLFWDTKLDETYTELQESMDSFQKQSEAEFRKWVVTIKNVLGSETAGNLQNEIEVLEYKLDALSDYRDKRIWENDAGDVYELNKYSVAGSRWATLEVTVFQSDNSVIRRRYVMDIDGIYRLEEKLLITFPDEPGMIARYELQDTAGDTYVLDSFVTSRKWWDG